MKNLEVSYYVEEKSTICVVKRCFVFYYAACCNRLLQQIQQFRF